jgi:hypothetical protein
MHHRHIPQNEINQTAKRCDLSFRGLHSALQRGGIASQKWRVPPEKRQAARNVDTVARREHAVVRDARRDAYAVLEARFICSETGFNEPGRGFHSSEGDGFRWRSQDDAGEGKLDRTRIPLTCGGITFEVVVARCNRRRRQFNVVKSPFNRGEIHIDQEVLK